jgi:cobalt-zinc-cadmium efflux system membrane fusion protein
MKLNWKVVVAVVLIAAGATGATLNKATRAQVIKVWHEIEKATSSHAESPPPDKSWLKDEKPKENWDRTVSLTPEEIQAIGLETAAVLSQTEPTVLALFGTTDYDPATVTTVRLMFDSRIDKVLVDLGSVIRKGDPLLELFSADLAAAKSDYELAVSQWNHDRRVYEYKTPLAKENTLPKKELIEVENDEAQSRLKMKLAKDKLLVYGLTEKEIEAAKDEDGREKARMTLRALADGVVVKRDVVNGNFYDSSSGTALLTIAPLDHLWVRGGVSELDADKVELGQEVKVIFPFAVTDSEIKSTIAYIDKAIDPETRAAKFRTTIPNLGGRFKAGAFVKVQVMVRPRSRQTVIPRAAMVSVGSSDYVFIRRQGTGKTTSFERRPIITARESNDTVIVAQPAEGHPELSPGEHVVTLGSLILEQMFEDRLMTEGGLLVSENGPQRPDHSHRDAIVVRTSH